LDALTSASGFIRRQIGSRIRLRHTPELTFAYDESVERGDRMIQLIDEVNKELGEE
jgi:ribosome-binding factor A